MNSKMLMSREKSSLLASRDKHSIVRSFQDTLKESQKKSRQRASKVKGETLQIVPAALSTRALHDAEKLAKDAGGRLVITIFQHFLESRPFPALSRYFRGRNSPSNTI